MTFSSILFVFLLENPSSGQSLNPALICFLRISPSDCEERQEPHGNRGDLTKGRNWTWIPDHLESSKKSCFFTLLISLFWVAKDSIMSQPYRKLGEFVNAECNEDSSFSDRLHQHEKSSISPSSSSTFPPLLTRIARSFLAFKISGRVPTYSFSSCLSAFKG